MYLQSAYARLAVACIATALCASPSEAWPVLFYPTDDAYVNMRDPDRNYGSSGRLLISNQFGYPAHGDNWEKNTLIRFDLSSIAPGTDITSGTLNLYFYDHWDNHPGGRDLTCYEITSEFEFEKILAIQKFVCLGIDLWFSFFNPQDSANDVFC